MNKKIIPAISTPTGVDRQRGYKTLRTRALWHLVQEAVNKPGEALASTDLVFEDRRGAVVEASRIRTSRNGTVQNAMLAVGARGLLEAWAEEHHFGHTLGMRFLPKALPANKISKEEMAAILAHPVATNAAREAANQ